MTTGHHYGPAWCPDCKVLWPESKWTMVGEVIFYWCPVCNGDLALPGEVGVDPVMRSDVADAYYGVQQELDL